MKQVILKAGIPAVLGVTGRYFRLFASDKEIDIEFYGSYDSGEWSLATPLKSGIGLNFAGRPAPFTQITIMSDIDQTIEYWASIDSADDDRLAASATVVVSTAGKTATVPVKQSLTDIALGHLVLAANSNRRSASFSINEACYLMDKDNGILLPSGIHTWENHSEMHLFPTVNPTEFRAMEETE